MRETMSERAFVARVAALGGLGSARDARRAIRATLAALAERLDDADAHAIEDAVPASFGGALHAKKHLGAFDVAELYDRVRRREGVSIGFAREHAQVVCRVVGESMSDEALARIEHALPPSFVELFEPPSHEPEEPAPPRKSEHARHRRTLATGRPGSTHPIAESAPRGAQSHSVVAEKNPYGERKLSSTRGLTQERLDESLATSKPDVSRRIDESSD
jgi:uncharacterized protein (DUF2267 family)